MLYTAGYGMTVLSAVSGTLVVIACFAFVDDTDIIHSRANTTGEQIGREMQDVMDTWEGGIRATGGALEPSKSHWYLLDFKWIPQRLRWDYRLQHKLPGTLFVRNPNGQREQLEQVEINEGRVTLGINITSDGSQDGEASYLMTKVQQWVSRFRANHLSHVDTWYAFNNTIMKTLEYPMIAILLSRKQWDKLISPLFAAILPKAKISRHCPWKVLFVPLSRQGLGLIHPHDRQHLSQIQTIFRHSDRHSDRHSPTRQLICASLEQLQLELGIPDPVFESSHELYGCLATPCWLSHIWQYSHSKGITLTPSIPQHLLQTTDPWTRPVPPCLQTRTTDDKFLMHLFVKAGYTGDKLFSLNVCRMHLHAAVTLSDIATANGVFITNQAWHGHHNESRRSPYHWPRTERPPNAVWQLWQQGLRLTALVPHQSQLRLRYAIGNWHDDKHLWSWFSSADRTTLYHREGPLWRTFRPQSKRNTRYSPNRPFY
jgi:hypothetical protein